MADSLQTGIVALKQGQFQVAVQRLEDYCHSNPEPLSPQLVKAQIYLIKAYRAIGQRQQAIDLCKQLMRSNHKQAQAWARKTLPQLESPTNHQSAAAATNAGRIIQTAAIAGVGPLNLHSDSPSSPSVEETQKFRPKTDAYFIHYFEKTLFPHIKSLEKQRMQLLRIGLLAALVPSVLAGLLVLVSKPLGAITGVVGYFIWPTFMMLKYRPYRTRFKQRIITKILEFIDSDVRLNHGGNFSYSQYPANASEPNLSVFQMLLGSINSQISLLFDSELDNCSDATRFAFCESRLFDKTPNRFSEEDCIQGKWGKTQLYFSEIEANRRENNSDGKTEYDTIFKGLFFKATFNKTFQGHTVVVPDFGRKRFGFLGNMFQSLNKNHGEELIKLEDPEFERLFAVYGDDQVEARYILSPSLMQQLINLQKKLDKELRIAFMENSIFIAISFKKNLFEPRIFRSLLNPEPTLEYFQILQTMLGIVDELNLNRRIWKQ